LMGMKDKIYFVALFVPFKFTCSNAWTRWRCGKSWLA